MAMITISEALSSRRWFALVALYTAASYVSLNHHDHHAALSICSITVTLSLILHVFTVTVNIQNIATPLATIVSAN